MSISDGKDRHISGIGLLGSLSTHWICTLWPQLVSGKYSRSTWHLSYAWLLLPPTLLLLRYFSWGQ